MKPVNDISVATNADRVRSMSANQCVICGAEMPEGDHVCKGCITRSEGDMKKALKESRHEYFSVDEDGIHIKAGIPSGAIGGAYTAVVDDSTSHITICGSAGEQVKSIIKALRGLADALATLTERGGKWQ